MIKLLGLDVGDKRIGLALSDDLGLTAQGRPTLQRTSLKKDLAALRNLIKEHQVQKVVVGLPLNMDGSLGTRAQLVLEFKNTLEKQLTIPVVTWDERLSTQAAQRPLREAGLNWRKRRKFVDQVAASIILQNYLDYKRQQERLKAESPNPGQK